VGRSGECFRDNQAPCLHGLGGLMWMWRPGVVMSDAAELVEVHTLRVDKPSDSHSRTACSLVPTTALNCIAAYPPPPRPVSDAPASCGRWR
jgi:hypothetical protein